MFGPQKEVDEMSLFREPVCLLFPREQKHPENGLFWKSSHSISTDMFLAPINIYSLTKHLNLWPKKCTFFGKPGRGCWPGGRRLSRWRRLSEMEEERRE